jgi:hypothetical protein
MHLPRAEYNSWIKARVLSAGLKLSDWGTAMTPRRRQSLNRFFKASSADRFAVEIVALWSADAELSGARSITASTIEIKETRFIHSAPYDWI